MSEKFAEGLIFFTFLLFFEFCLVLLDPLIEDWSGGEPLYKLLFNAILAGAIFPAHAFFENTLKNRLLKKENLNSKRLIEIEIEPGLKLVADLDWKTDLDNQEIIELLIMGICTKL